MRYFLHVWIALDQLVTAMLGGWPDESLSSYAYRLKKQDKPFGRLFAPMIDWLFSWQGYKEGHCAAAYEEERLRYQLPPELR